MQVGISIIMSDKYFTLDDHHDGDFLMLMKNKKYISDDMTV